MRPGKTNADEPGQRSRSHFLHDGGTVVFDRALVDPKIGGDGLAAMAGKDEASGRTGRPFEIARLRTGCPRARWIFVTAGAMVSVRTVPGDKNRRASKIKSNGEERCRS
jgi:hypothetical protein